ncbi:MAG: UDP-glucose 4-epimerase GalE [Limnohabitans sp.]|nr:UDP-glucose 4-epimerase GalE [Limnohabitans sp.]
MKILVTGGTGYIGSHTCVQLIEKGWQPVIIDSLVNSKISVLERIEKITGTRPAFVEGDVRDADLLQKVLREHAIEAVIHFAGLKAVGESISMPLKYYDNNVHGSVVLMEAMKQCNVKTLVFSSSATVYGDATKMPLKEDAPTSATNPYGQSKLMVEKIIADLCTSNPSWSITALRYFNPVGAHESGLIGEDPQGIPNNLMPFLAQVAVGRREELQVFGNDYQTPDGTGVRDYIHVIDLAQGHLCALAHAHGKAGYHVFNLGTGKGNSVLEMLNAFGKACGKKLKYKIASRRPGDVAASWADPQKAQSVLNWKAEKSMDDMCQDTWHWQSQNPNGYP